MDNIIQLNHELVNGIYNHGGYKSFWVFDPKPRHIHKASVRDRLLHHAIYRILYPIFDKQFISDSFSCRINKGTHKAMDRFRYFHRKVSKNNTKTCWVLKCDIRKFFENIDHAILLNILRRYISDKKVIWLLERVIKSFSKYPALSRVKATNNSGLPLGNLTSQLFVNIYMNEFDQFVKHKLKIKYYIRYADDFILLSRGITESITLIPRINDFLENNLKLSLHPQKVFIKTLASGVDFLGWVHFSDHRVLKTAAKRRMLKRIQNHPTSETRQSYLGLLKHGNTKKLIKYLRALL